MLLKVQMMRVFIAFLLLCPLGRAQESGPNRFAALVGRVEAANLKYKGLGRQHGRAYEGYVRVRVTRVFNQSRSQVELEQGQVIRLQAAEQNRKPDWELSTAKQFIFIVEPLPDGQFKPLAVLPTEPSQTIKDGIADCMAQVNLARNKAQIPVLLGSASLMERVMQSKAMEIPGLLDGHIKGSVTLLLVINEQGRVECVSALQGHPIALGSAVSAVKDWHFRPFVEDGQPYSVLGTLSLDYDFQR